MVTEDPFDVRISIGKAYEVLQPYRREATEEFAESLRVKGLSVQLDVIEYVPGRRGLGPIEWTAIFIGNGIASSLISNITDDLYQGCRNLLRRRRRHTRATGRGRKRLGFTIYGPNGEVLRTWTTDEDADEDVEDPRYGKRDD